MKPSGLYYLALASTGAGFPLLDFFKSNRPVPVTPRSEDLPLPLKPRCMTGSLPGPTATFIFPTATRTQPTGTFTDPSWVTMTILPDSSDPNDPSSTDPTGSSSGDPNEPSGGGSDDPASGGSDDPASGGSDDPTSGGSNDPASGGSNDPASGGSDGPGSDGSGSDGSGGGDIFPDVTTTTPVVPAFTTSGPIGTALAPPTAAATLTPSAASNGTQATRARDISPKIVRRKDSIRPWRLRRRVQAIQM